MPAYDATWFDPPAPVAIVSVHNPQTGITRSDVPMLLDSGADVSLIPQSFIEQLGPDLIADSVYERMGFDGTTSFTPVVQIELLFLCRTFRGRFLVLDQEWDILGRDISTATAVRKSTTPSRTFAALPT
ncbi:MAG: retropepsin-like aspartic protease [Anaerolineae bacterium]